MQNILSATRGATRLLAYHLICFGLLAFFPACELEETNPYRGNKGRITFWTSLPNGYNSISIFIKGNLAGSLTHYYTNGTPNCNDSGPGTVGFTGEPGTYLYRATSDTGFTWEGSFTITKGECQLLELQGASNSLPSQYDNQGTITVRSRNIQIAVFDYSKIDGDVLSLVFNGQTIVSNLEITASKRIYTLSNLPLGSNWIGVLAVNEGSDPPCTPRIEINDGFKTQAFEIRAYINKPGGYLINVQL